MRNNGTFRPLMAALLGCLVGCADLPRLASFRHDSARDSGEAQALAEQRYAFLTARDPAALDWLLTHAVHSGQTVGEVEQVLGQTAEREHADRELKTSAGNYLETDVGYRWGPDANGRSIVLFFREGRLVNFDPSELAR
uniref:Outer membrane protein assembly factor BamE n=1 Tax=Schlesneria paludicola TaxID=360056 RepID=A0A7C2P9U8_9PLAN